jgi:hypothetical protein
MASVSNLRFRQSIQRQPDGAFVLAQRSGDLGDGCLAVARAPDPRGKLVQATRGIAAKVIHSVSLSISRTINHSVFAVGIGFVVMADLLTRFVTLGRPPRPHG